MDVERIQKINTLALDLMKKGLAQDREDAVLQAERIFRSRDADENRTIRETMKEVRSYGNAQSTADSADLSTEKVKDILEKNTAFMIKQLKEFQEKVASLEKEVTLLRTQATYQKGPTVREFVSQTEPPKLEEIPVKPREQQLQESQSNPRSGSYKNEDVSIEKFFYMGNK